jgi:drug/metabolite transporter (DMT)-like permease
LLSVLWSVLFLQERLSTWQWIGGFFILASAILAARRLSRVH